MKKLLLILFLLASVISKAQQSDYATLAENPKVSLVPNKIDLHMSKYNDKMNTGKGFVFAGAFLYAVSAGIVQANSKNQNLGMAIATIGGTFQMYGFLNIVTARRHLKMAWAAEKTAVR